MWRKNVHYVTRTLLYNTIPSHDEELRETIGICEVCLKTESWKVEDAKGCPIERWKERF